MKSTPKGAALAGLGLLLVNGAVAPEAAAASALPSEPLAAHSPALSQAAEVATTQADGHVVNINGHVSNVSSAQIAAYQNLSTSLQAKITAADEHDVAYIPIQRGSTIMCPW